MRKLLPVVLLLLFAPFARGQATYPVSYSNGGNITSTNSGCVPTACVGIGLPTPAAAVITVGITGTFSATLAVEESQDGGTTFTSAGTALTTTGTTSYIIAGLTTFRVRASAYASGNAGVSLQVSNAPTGGVTSGAGAPSGSCAANQLYVDNTTGNLYSCDAGTWVQVGGDGGSGTVTSVSSGNFSPLFNVSVATATTTPAFSFAAISQNANLVYAGPSTGAAAAPTFRALVSADLPAGTGTVTSVGFTGGLISVATPTTTPAFTVAGTSGGIPYFSGASTWASSAAGTVNTLMKWGGAGNPPTASSCTDNGTTVACTESISTTGGFTAGAGAGIGWNGVSLIKSGANGRINILNNGQAPNGTTRITFGTEQSGVPALCFDGSTQQVITCDGAGTTANGIFTSAIYKTNTNCSSAASPAVCAAANAGSVNIAASATTIVVNTTAVSANSQIMIQEDSSLGTKLSVTCNTTTGRTYTVSARTAATSFTVTASAAPTTNPACLSYWVLN